MNKKLCLYHRKKKTWKRTLCGVCNRYNTCITRKEYDFAHDERREMIPNNGGVNDEEREEVKAVKD